MELKVKRLDPYATLPRKAHGDDAGYDLHAFVGGHLGVGKRDLVLTGVAVAIPPGHVGLVCPRSGLAAKYGVTVANAPGIIDSGYRGEVLVNLVNHGDNTFEWDPGDRIAQLVVVPVADTTLVKVDDLDETERGHGGHGSTGK